MVPVARQPQRPGRAQRRPLGRSAWLDAARSALIEEGTAGVEVNKLAKRLGVSRGGFYWFFNGRQQLLDELLEYWSRTGTALFERILDRAGHDGLREFRTLVDLWIGEHDYDPRWDGAVRDWARTSAKVRRAVQRVDCRRIATLEQIFVDLGYRGIEAHVRARITYYHQVGYYALGVRESRKVRLRLSPIYTQVLIGRRNAGS